MGNGRRRIGVDGVGKIRDEYPQQKICHAWRIRIGISERLAQKLPEERHQVEFFDFRPWPGRLLWVEFSIPAKCVEEFHQDGEGFRLIRTGNHRQHFQVDLVFPVIGGNPFFQAVEPVLTFKKCFSCLNIRSDALMVQIHLFQCDRSGVRKKSITVKADIEQPVIFRRRFMPGGIQHIFTGGVVDFEFDFQLEGAVAIHPQYFGIHQFKRWQYLFELFFAVVPEDDAFVLFRKNPVDCV